jgi:hypothetical protein
LLLFELITESMSPDFIERCYNRVKVNQRVADGYVNLNQMAKATDKRIDNWMRLQETTSLLREFSEDPIYAGSQPLVTLEGRTGGTWAHPDIALQFAQWCNPGFALQVSRWIREWMTTGRNPLADTDRVGLRDVLKDDSRLRMTDQVKVYLEQMKRYDDKKYRGQFFSRVHDAINVAVTGETAGQMRERLGIVLGRKVTAPELIRDYFPSAVLQRYISMCEASANLMLKRQAHPLDAVREAADLVLPGGYSPEPIDFVEHVKFVRGRITTGQLGLPGAS